MIWKWLRNQNNVDILLTGIRDVILSNDYTKVDELIDKQQEMLEQKALIKKNQIRRIKYKEVGTKNSLLYFTITNETKNLILNAVNLLKSQRDFTLHDEEKQKSQ